MRDRSCFHAAWHTKKVFMQHGIHAILNLGITNSWELCDVTKDLHGGKKRNELLSCPRTHKHGHTGVCDNADTRGHTRRSAQKQKMAHGAVVSVIMELILLGCGHRFVGKV